MSEIPERSILAVTVPGALHGWAQALERYGTLKLQDVFEDAIYYAAEWISCDGGHFRGVERSRKPSPFF